MTPLIYLKGNDSKIQKSLVLGGLPNRSLGSSIISRGWLQLVFPSVFAIVRKLMVRDSYQAYIGQVIKSLIKTKDILSALLFICLCTSLRNWNIHIF